MKSQYTFLIALTLTTLAAAAAITAWQEDPMVTSAHQSVSNATQNVATPQPSVRLDMGALYRDAKVLEATHGDLLANGMEDNAKGWHVILPGDFTISPGGSTFPSVYRYRCANGMSFFDVGGHETGYYPVGFWQNGGGVANMDVTAPMSFYRPFSNAVAALVKVSGSNGNWDVVANFSPRALDLIESFFAEQSSSSSGYIDWFGQPKLSADPPTERRMALVANNVAYAIVDVDDLLAEHALSPQATLLRTAANGVTIVEADHLLNAN